MPEISVIITAYNCEEYIEETVRSVLRQSEPEFEIIVVDDGSTDRTPVRLEGLAAGESRLKVLTQPNAGRPAVGRNRALSEAQGRFVCFLDGDDLYHPDKIRRSLDVFAAYPEVDIVFHDVSLFDQDPLERNLPTYLGNVRFVEKSTDFLENVGANVLLAGERFYNFLSTEINGLHTSSVMFRRDLIVDEPKWFREDLYITDDTDAWLRLAMIGRVALINEVLSYYRQHSGSISRNRERMMRERITVHTENLKRGREVFSAEEIRKYRLKIALDYLTYGYSSFLRSRRAEARNAYKQSMILRPKVQTLFAYLKTYAPDWVVQRYRKDVASSE